FSALFPVPSLAPCPFFLFLLVLPLVTLIAGRCTPYLSSAPTSGPHLTSPERKYPKRRNCQEHKSDAPMRLCFPSWCWAPL
ncbi:hypothetical protein K443DRAFT_354881, partial [Laccaria amethystina LaAM-08-1]